MNKTSKYSKFKYQNNTLKNWYTMLRQYRGKKVNQNAVPETNLNEFISSNICTEDLQNNFKLMKKNKKSFTHPEIKNYEILPRIIHKKESYNIKSNNSSDSSYSSNNDDHLSEDGNINNSDDDDEDFDDSLEDYDLIDVADPSSILCEKDIEKNEIDRYYEYVPRSYPAKRSNIPCVYIPGNKLLNDKKKYDPNLFHNDNYNKYVPTQSELQKLLVQCRLKLQKQQVLALHTIIKKGNDSSGSFFSKDNSKHGLVVYPREKKSRISRLSNLNDQNNRHEEPRVTTTPGLYITNKELLQRRVMTLMNLLNSGKTNELLNNQLNMTNSGSYINSSDYYVDNEGSIKLGSQINYNNLRSESSYINSFSARWRIFAIIQRHVEQNSCSDMKTNNIIPKESLMLVENEKVSSNLNDKINNDNIFDETILSFANSSLSVKLLNQRLYTSLVRHLQINNAQQLQKEDQLNDQKQKQSELMKETKPSKDDIESSLNNGPSKKYLKKKEMESERHRYHNKSLQDKEQGRSNGRLDQKPYLLGNTSKQGQY